MSRREQRRTAKAVIDVLRRRDGPNCHLCGGMVSFTIRGMPQSATRDHIIPRSEGGPNTLDNLKLAHRSCNIARGVMSLDEWFSARRGVQTLNERRAKMLKSTPLDTAWRNTLIRQGARRGLTFRFDEPEITSEGKPE